MNNYMKTSIYIYIILGGRFMHLVIGNSEP